MEQDERCNLCGRPAVADDGDGIDYCNYCVNIPGGIWDVFVGLVDYFEIPEDWTNSAFVTSGTWTKENVHEYPAIKRRLIAVGKRYLKTNKQRLEEFRKSQ